MSHLLIVIISLLFSAFFSGMQFSFLSSNKLRLELNRKQGKFPSEIVDIFVRHPEKYLSAMRIGYVISLVVFGIAAALLLEPIMSSFMPVEAVLLVQIITAALFFFLAAEFLPGILFRMNPNFTLDAFAVPALIFYILFYPITLLVKGIADIMLKMFTKTDPQKTNPEVVFGKAYRDDFNNEAQIVTKEEQDAEHEIKIFRNALDFSSVKLRDCMIPRTDIVAIEENASIAELKQKFIDTGVSKIVVYHEDIDNIIGYVHSKELFKNPVSVSAMLNQLTFVPETMSGNRMMQLFMQERRSIAIVVDEYGGTAGLLTLEDLIEEIFGDIEDEHDKDNLVERQIAENEYLLSGRLEIEYINETFKLNIPEKDDYDTLAGFILYHHLNLPLAGEMIRIEPYTFIIRKISNTRIDLVQMTIDKK